MSTETYIPFRVCLTHRTERAGMFDLLDGPDPRNVTVPLTLLSKGCRAAVNDARYGAHLTIRIATWKARDLGILAARLKPAPQGTLFAQGEIS